MTNPHKVTQDFERALCEYTGAPYAVAVNSCTMALLLAVAWHLRNNKPRKMEMASKPFQDCELDSLQNAINKVHNDNLTPVKVNIPRRTYISVPQAIINAGGRPTFRDEGWSGMYQLKPLPIWDSARYFTKDLWTQRKGFCCVSFHASKTLGLEQGGAILHDNQEADAWLRRARFDGRTEGVAPKDDKFDMIGHHCYLNPSTAAQGILRLHSLPQHNAPLENDPYPDLSQMEIFR